MHVSWNNIVFHHYTINQTLRGDPWPVFYSGSQKSSSGAEDHSEERSMLICSAAPKSTCNMYIKCSFISFYFFAIASPDLLRQLLKFWTGWEVPVQSLSLQVVQSRGRHHLPTASTCYERLRIPDHYSSFVSLQSDLMICLRSVESGFGLI